MLCLQTKVEAGSQVSKKAEKAGELPVKTPCSSNMQVRTCNQRQQQDCNAKLPGHVARVI